MTGFDPAARRKAWDLVDRLRDLGTTILLTTHYLDEAEHLADRVVVIDRGRVVAEGTPAELAARAGSRTVVAFRLPPGRSADEPSADTRHCLTAYGKKRAASKCRCLTFEPVTYCIRSMQCTPMSIIAPPPPFFLL